MALPGEMTSTRAGFNAEFWRQYKGLMSILYPMIRSRLAVLSVIAILVLIGSQVIAYFSGLLIGEFYFVLLAKQGSLFSSLLVRTALLLLAVAVTQALFEFGTDAVALLWRIKLTSMLHAKYLSSRAFYDIIHYARFDNIDQRITTDVSSWCQVNARLISNLVLNPALIIVYTVLVWQRTGWVGPLVIYSYYILAFVINKVLLLSGIVSLVWHQERLEGDFRATHVSLLRHSEQIAMLHGERLERQRANTALGHLVANQQQLIQRRLFVNLTNEFMARIGAILNYIVIGIAVFSGLHFTSPDPAELAKDISQAAFIAFQLSYAFTSFFNMANEFAELAGYTRRLSELIAELNALQQQSVAKSAALTRKAGRDTAAADAVASVAAPSALFADAAPVVSSVDPQHAAGKHDIPSEGVLAELPAVDFVPSRDRVQLHELSYSTPDGRRLNTIVDVSVRPGCNTLIRGPSGCGKTSLMRILAQLWPRDAGTVHRPAVVGADGLFFVAARPYVSVGTLMEQMIYPHSLEAAAQAATPGCVRRLLRLAALPRDTLGGAGPRAGNQDKSSEDEEAQPLVLGTADHAINLADRAVRYNPPAYAPTPALLAELLRIVGLEQLPEQHGGWHQVQDWPGILSAGQVQRLALTRVLYHNPRFVVLDESTSNIGVEIEAAFYRALRARHITAISVSHRESLLQHHDMELEMCKDGTTHVRTLTSRGKA